MASPLADALARLNTLIAARPLSATNRWHIVVDLSDIHVLPSATPCSDSDIIATFTEDDALQGLDPDTWTLIERKLAIWLYL